MDSRIEALLRQLLQEKQDNRDQLRAIRRLQQEQESCFPWQKLHPHASLPPRVPTPVDNLILIISETGIILSANHPIERLVGRSDLLGSPIWDLFTQPHTAETLRTILHSFLSQGTQPQFELTLTSCDGNHHSILWSLDRWLCDEQQPQMIVMAGLELPQPFK